MTSTTARRRLRATLAVTSTLVLGLSSALVAPQAQAAPKTPNVAKLAGSLAKQKLAWETCDFGDASLNERFATRANVKCADVTVPRDWHNPGNGKTWTIRISQTTNIDPSNPRSKGAILGNPGGPGAPGLIYGAALPDLAPDLRPYYNFIGMDPRGVGQSSQVECEYTYDAASTDPLAETKAIGTQCSSDPDVATITTEQTTYDMDFIRHLLKQKKLGYIGYSYGTWLGAWYGNVFGANAGPMLLDSSTDVTKPTLQRTWELQPIARDRQFDMRMLHWLARQDATYHLGTDPLAIKDRYFAATKNIDPITVLLIWYLGGGMDAFSVNALYPAMGDVVTSLIEYGEQLGTADDSTDPATAAQTIMKGLATNATSTEARAAAKAAAPKLAALAKTGTLPQAKAQAEPEMVTTTINEPFEFIRCGDGQWTQGERYWQSWAKRNAPKAQLSDSWGAFEVPICAFWKTNNMMPAATKDHPKTVVIQDEMDSQTAWETGRTTATKLPNTSAIFVDNEGTHGVFPYGTECVDRPVINFFLNGKLPKDIKVCQGLPLPEETITYESWAKLNAKGQHVPGAAGPFTPAKTGAKATSSTLAATDLGEAPGEADVVSQVRSEIQKRYGEKGVAAATSSGLLG